ncbi:hypothetical protein Pyn_20198 [Prunus yedoensis var. nudiflora]|uniref:Uncharacterized protein n=1 Tax=Prunus yedoensis var. nudiflora TaxID=2094558 RepID=A0A314YGC8_PRUYE|nr:hypothetical protein Pyn_20198 [Prunus yedoensis var. nudiflora]
MDRCIYSNGLGTSLISWTGFEESLIESTGGAKEWGCWLLFGGDAKSSSMKRVLVDFFGVRLNGK